MIERFRRLARPISARLSLALRVAVLTTGAVALTLGIVERDRLRDGAGGVPSRSTTR